MREGMVTAAWLGNAGLALARSHGRTGTRVSQEELDRLVDATEKVRRAGVLLNQVVVSIDLAGDAAQLAFLAHLGDAVANLLKRRRRRPRCGSWIQRCRARPVRRRRAGTGRSRIWPGQPGRSDSGVRVRLRCHPGHDYGAAGDHRQPDRRCPVMRLAVVNTKGGVGKTTTAIYVAAGLHRQDRTLLIDADPQQSAYLWAEQDPIFPFTVISRPMRDLHHRLSSLSRGYEHVIIDTPPGDSGIIGSAVMAADTVIIPASPTGLDLNRIMPTISLLASLEPVHPVEVGVLLTRVRRGTLSARGVRDVLAETGLPVMDTEIPLAEMYAGSFGTAPVDLGRYDDLIRELKS